MGDESKLCSFHQAVIEGDVKQVEKLILRKTSTLDERDDKNRTALHIGALYNQSDIVEWLLIARTNRALKSSLDINAVDSDGNSALHLALQIPNLKPALLLLKDDASPFLPNHKKETPFFLFCKVSNNLKEEDIEVIIYLFFFFYFFFLINIFLYFFLFFRILKILFH